MFQLVRVVMRLNRCLRIVQNLPVSRGDVLECVRLYKPFPGFIVFVVLLFLSGCASSGSSQSATAAASNPAARVAGLQIVDCLLPGMVRKLGTGQYLTPRRPIRTTATECNIRGGEYTAYDRADYKSALLVWMPSAKSGDPEAQANVGEILERGLGGEPNYELAAFWYEKAAKQDNTRAMFNLGTLYEQGLGVEKDRLTALNWYRKAWDMPADSLVYQSVANKETTKLRAELSAAIQQRDSRIRILERDLERLQKQSQDGLRSTDKAALEQEVEDLHLWIDALESERSESVARLDSIPKVREPQAAGAVEQRLVSGRQIKSGELDFGRYYALLVGNQDYSKIEPLSTPENDVEIVADLLQRKYGFHVEVLLNVDDVQLMEKINDLSEQLGDNDNLLIYYAGHGVRIDNGEVKSGYWLPVNADAPPRNTFWVANEFITGHLGRIPARRVMVVADSCYAGLLSDAPGYLMLAEAPQNTAEFMSYKLPKRSRLLISSGGDSPVLDNGAPGHSVFASVLIETLENNNEILSGPQLFAAIDDKVRKRSAANGFEQEPEYKAIKGARHELGDFFFVPI